MRVRIRRLELMDFRNYASFVLEPAEGLTVLVGPNATGKTNVVEAVELVTEISSFRNPAWSDLVRSGQERALVINHAESDAGGKIDIALTIEGSRRTYRMNGAVKRTIAEVTGDVPAVVFTPDDLRMIKEGADRRRAAVDSVGTQVSRAYAQLKAEYDRLLRQRNALLKDPDTPAQELDPWTLQLARTGAALSEKRASLVEKMSPDVATEHEALSGGEQLSATYEASWSDGPITEEGLLGRLRELESAERARRTTLAGPHRDDVRFEIDGADARTFASQGQQRTAALAWKLAEVEIIEELSGITPILLLDDVMSELDESRRHELAERVRRRTQTIMTTTNLGYFAPELIAEASVVELS